MEEVVEPLAQVGASLRDQWTSGRQQSPQPVALTRWRVGDPAEAWEGGLDGLDHV